MEQCLGDKPSLNYNYNLIGQDLVRLPLDLHHAYRLKMVLKI